MADVFISYAREDRARAEQVARGLSAVGLDAFWDTEIPPGQTWADYVEAKLTNCKAVVVLWSEHSTRSQWVREEARMGRDTSKLIPAMLDATPPPFGFGEVQAANLSAWRGEANHPEWTRFSHAVHAAVRGAAAAPPQPTPQAAWTAPPAYSAASGHAAAAVSPSTAAASPLTHIATCFRKYVDGTGRARRAEYWWWIGFMFAVAVAAYMMDAAVGGADPYSGEPYNPMISGIAVLALLAPWVSVSSRRLHDLGFSGWFAAAIPAFLLGGGAVDDETLGGVLSLIGLVGLIAIGVKSGPSEANAYGPDPKPA